MELIPNWHPLLVHFTIALYIISALLFVVGFFMFGKWQEKIHHAAYINLWLGALITIFTVAAGIYAYNTVGHDTPSHLAMTNHKNWALVAAGFFSALAIWSIYRYRSGKAVGISFVIAMVVGAGLIGVTGFKGGEIVYRYGLGVMSLPQVEGEGHGSHSHEDGAAGQDEANKTPPSHDDSGAAPHDHDEKVPEKKEEKPHKDDGHSHKHE